MKTLSAKPAVHILIVALVGLLAYSNTFHVPFVFDDEYSIVRNHAIRDWSSFFSNTGLAFNPRRLVGYLTFALNYRLGGLSVTGYHVFNLCVHITTSLLLYGLVVLTFAAPRLRRSTLAVHAPSLALFAALLFVAHPVQTQAVTYIVQRLASLATMFFVLALVLYAQGRLWHEQGRNAGKWLLFAGALGSVALAMKTKEIAFTLPIIIALYEFLFFTMTARKKLLLLAPVFLMLFIIPVSIVAAGRPVGELISDVTEITRVDTAIPRIDYLLTQFRVMVTYLRLLVLPVNQNLDYDYHVYSSFLTPAVLLSFLLLAAILFTAVYLILRVRRGGDPALLAVSFGILWFFVTLSVESSIIPIADVIFEHRLYLPSVGAFVAASVAAGLFLRRKSARMVVSLAGAAILLLASGTFARNMIWRDELTLWSDAARKSPHKGRPRYNVAFLLHRDGKFPEAFREAQNAVRLDPGRAESHNLYGTLLTARGAHEKGASEFREALKIDPGYAPAHNNLGDYYSSAGMKEQALEAYMTSLKIEPTNAETYNKIGVIHAESGMMNDAAVFFESALRLDPENRAYLYNLQRARISAAQEKR